MGGGGVNSGFISGVKMEKLVIVFEGMSFWGVYDGTGGGGRERNSNSSSSSSSVCW